MLYLIIGENDFNIKEEIKKISSETSTISYKEKNFNEELTKLLNNRLFGINNFIAIKDLEKIEIKKDFLNAIRNKNIILIFKQKPETFIKNLKNLKINFVIKEVPSLRFKNIKEFSEFIKEYVKNEGINIPQESIPVLAKIFLNSPEVLINELKKVKAYSEGRRITKEEFLNLIKWPTESQIFEMVDCLLDKNYKDFILRLKRELSLGNKLENIIGLIYKTLLRIYLLKKAKNYKEEQDLKLNYYYKKKLSYYKNNFSEEEIKKWLNFLSEIDRKYKKFLLKENDVISEFIHNIS